MLTQLAVGHNRQAAAVQDEAVLARQVDNSPRGRVWPPLGHAQRLVGFPVRGFNLSGRHLLVEGVVREQGRAVRPSTPRGFICV